MGNLLELAARCEAATGPDRELDACIWWATRAPDEIAYLDRSGYVRECIERDGSAGKALAQFYDSANPYCLAKVAFQRAYTASLDAAMKLVPEGFDWIIEHVNGGLTIGARVGHNDPDRTSWGATAALALCAAALRARHDHKEPNPRKAPNSLKSGSGRSEAPMPVKTAIKGED